MVALNEDSVVKKTQVLARKSNSINVVCLLLLDYKTSLVALERARERGKGRARERERERGRKREYVCVCVCVCVCVFDIDPEIQLVGVWVWEYTPDCCDPCLI
jgi:hypothetical protein